MINTPILVSATASIVLAQAAVPSPGFAITAVGLVLWIIVGSATCAAVIAFLSGPIAKTKVSFVPALITAAIVITITQVISLVPLIGLIALVVFPVLMVLLLKQRHAIATWPAVGLTAIMYVAFIILGFILVSAAVAIGAAMGLATSGTTP